MVVVYLMVEFYIDIRVVLILVFAHGPSPLLALTGQGMTKVATWSQWRRRRFATHLMYIVSFLHGSIYTRLTWFLQSTATLSSEQLFCENGKILKRAYFAQK